MIVKFDKLSIEGFMSISSANINFSDKGFVLVVGNNKYAKDNAKSNGSGKSAIFESLFWTLTGSTIRGVKDVVNTEYPRGCSCSLDIVCDSDTYRIIRSKSHDELGTSLRLYKNGEDISGKGIKDTDALISKILSQVSSEVLSSVIVLGQGLPNRFTSYSPSGRKSLLESLSGLSESFDDTNTRVSNRKAIIQSELTKYSTSLASNKSLLSSYERMIDNKLAQKESVSNESYDQLKSKIDTLNSQKLRLLDDQSKIETSRKEIRSEYSSNNIEIQTINKLLNELLIKRTSLENEKSSIYKSFESKICPTCGRPMEGADETAGLLRISQIDKEIENLNDQIRPHQQSIDTKRIQSDSIKMTLDTIDEEYSRLNLKVNELNSELSKLNSTLSIIETIDKDLADLTDKVSRCSESIKSDEIAFNNLLNHQKAVDYISRVCSREFRGYMLDGVINYINSRLEIYSEKLFSSNYIDFVLEGNNIAIYVNKKSYDGLSGGEKQKVDLAIQFSLRDMIMNISGFRCNIMVLDEVFDNLDETGCDRLLDLLSSNFSDIESLYIITHHSDINVPYDNRILVEKMDNNLSYVRGGE